jgi:hypothetical protein
MVIYKFINENKIEKFKGYIINGRQVITGVMAYQLAKDKMYKPLRIEEKPTINDNQYLKRYYSETESEIIQHWEVVTVENSEPSFEQRLEVMEFAMQDLILALYGGV